jgi:predicted transcriptional regulator
MSTATNKGGRPAKGGRAVSYRLSADTLARIDSLAKRWRTTRTGAVERAVSSAVQPSNSRTK